MSRARRRTRGGRRATWAVVGLLALASRAEAAAAADAAAEAAPEARQRLAVLVVTEGSADAGLAENLAEVIISVIAERRDRELVGLRELRPRLESVAAGQGLGACLADPPCLARVGDAAGAARAVIGRVTRSPDGYVVQLALTDTQTAEEAARVARETPPELAPLIAAVRAATAELLARESPPPPAAPAAEPDRASLAEPPALLPVDRAAAERAPPIGGARPGEPATAAGGGGRPGGAGARAAPYLGAGAAGLSVICFSGAAVTGSFAIAAPVGNTRLETQNDLRRRSDYATAANGLLVAGGVLAIGAGAALMWWWRSEHGHLR